MLDAKTRQDFFVQVASGVAAALVMVILGLTPAVRTAILEKVNVPIGIILLVAALSAASAAALTFVLQQRRINEWKTAALTDHLTQVPNYAGIDAELDRQISIHASTQSRFCCIVFDINGFKSFNDRLGTEVGDSVVKQTVGFLRENTRPARGDTLMRYKLGDEFLLVLPNTHGEGAIACANRLLRDFQEFGVQLGSRYDREHPTLSAGIAEFIPDGDTRTKLRARLDEALTKAKAEHGKVLLIRRS